MVASSWAFVPIVGNSFKILHAKLRAMTNALSRWSSKWIGNIKLQILLAIEVIFQLDVAMESHAHSTYDVALRRTLKRKLLGLSSLEQTIAGRKSILLCLKEGDVNTRFFH